MSRRHDARSARSCTKIRSSASASSPTNTRVPKESAPHDHGPSWAIYGQASGETQMSDYELVEPATPEKPGKVRKTRTYKLTPGVAHVYNEGDLHSPTRTGPTRLIRIEGTNMEKVKRLKFEPV